jgi:hypothetical protein
MFRHSAIFVTVALIGVLALAADVPASSPDEQLPAGPMQEKAAAACVGCHEARIIVQQRLSKAAWTREVDKMAKWGAKVDGVDRDGLIDYFSANFSPETAAYSAPRTLGVSSKTVKKAKK